MALVDVLRGLTKGVAESAGNEDAVRDLSLQQAQARAHRQQQSASDLQAQIAPLTQASAGLQKRIVDLTDPTTGKPYTGQEQQHSDLVNQLSDVIGKTRMILHPPPAEDPHGLGYLAHRATDALHITNDAAQKAQQAQSGKVNSYYQNLNDWSKGAAQNLTAGQGNPLSPEQQAQAAKIHAGITPKAAAPKSPSESDKKRQDYENDESKLPNETFEQWTARQGTIGRSRNKPYSFDPKTGQVVDPVSGSRYSRTDVDMPTDVKKMFDSQQAAQDSARGFQEKLVNARASQYAKARWQTPYRVIDTANQNTPTYATFAQMQEQPNRFLPATDAEKAMQRQTFLYDVHDNSKKMRTVINKMPEFDNELRGKLAFALKSEDPGVLRSVLASDTIGSLQPEQQDFLIQLAQLKENALALRSALGTGQGAQDVRAAIQNTLPNVLSPDKGYALRQLDAFDATLDRLHRGVPNVPINMNATFNEQGGKAPKGPKTQQLEGMRGGQTKGIVRLSKARALPQFQGMSDAQIAAAAQARGYEVQP